ncbi:host attachment protein [Pseudoduganella sp. RAF53_2]|jgi:protein required for attachment to host cells|uniref:host attachment protein n=1 Tax=unclassified Pseudoduganella TaxID=2637179 RepID=UPI003F962E5D
MEKTWVVVADSSHARIFRVRDAQHSLEEVEDMANPLGRADNRQIESDANSQFYSPNGQHPTYSPSEDAVEHEVHQFARQLARRLDTAAAQNQYDHLCLIAAPKFLGLLRDSLNHSTRKLVIAESNKNFASFPRPEIEACVRGLALRPGGA